LNEFPTIETFIGRTKIIEHLSFLQTIAC